MKLFHLGDVLTITHERLVSPRRIDGVYDILNYMTGESLFTHQLPRAGRACAPALLKQLIEMLESPNGKAEPEMLVDGWLAKQVARYGEMLGVEPLSSGEYISMDAILEAEAMVGKERVVTVEIDSHRTAS